jgi:formate hydrogenlyase subunit 4
MISFYGGEVSYFQVITAAIFVVCGPLVGGLIAGFDRKITARMQGRQGPPILQPFFDVLKLMEKESATVRGSQDFYIMTSLIFCVITGVFFFGGGNLLMVIFTLTTADIILVLGGFASNSPYSQIGAERELVQLMSTEPMIILLTIGLFLAKGSFTVTDLISSGPVAFPYLAGLFIGVLYIFTIKLRKSPFDLSMSHHMHQELVKGLTTEFSGRTLAAIEVMHWYETVIFLGLIFLFFTNGTPLWWALGIVVCLFLYFVEILIDNTYARMRWQFTLKSAWVVTIIFGGANLLVLYYLHASQLLG